MELNWDNAKAWQDAANAQKEFDEPKWRWDCSFKLDFDGPILSVSSRFYPPHKNIAGGWEGDVKISVFGQLVMKKSFKCATLDQLKKEVEAFVAHYKNIVISRLIP